MTDTADRTEAADTAGTTPRRVAITGGTGFVGGHLARRLVAEGHHVVLIARGVDRRDTAIRDLPGVTFVACQLNDNQELARAFAGCDAVAHCAGINREVGGVTYEQVHVEGTRHVVDAAEQAGVRRLALVSFLRARPGMTAPAPGSGYFESKWRAEQIVRASGLDYTVLKCGVIYGRGDHMLDHLSHAFHSFPVFGFVGYRDQHIAPAAVTDVVRVLRAALIEERLTRKTVPVVGPDSLTLRDAVRQVARVVGRKPIYMRLPVWSLYAMGWVLERMMKTPMVSTAQVRMLSEGITRTDDLPIALDALPDDLQPSTLFTDSAIRAGLPEPGRFGLRDCRCVDRCLGRFGRVESAGT